MAHRSDDDVNFPGQQSRQQLMPRQHVYLNVEPHPIGDDLHQFGVESKVGPNCVR
jgi:hypothetical protein